MDENNLGDQVEIRCLPTFTSPDDVQMHGLLSSLCIARVETPRHVRDNLNLLTCSRLEQMRHLHATTSTGSVTMLQAAHGYNG